MNVEKLNRISEIIANVIKTKFYVNTFCITAFHELYNLDSFYEDLVKALQLVPDDNKDKLAFTLRDVLEDSMHCLSYPLSEVYNSDAFYRELVNECLKDGTQEQIDDAMDRIRSRLYDMLVLMNKEDKNKTPFMINVSSSEVAIRVSNLMDCESEVNDLFPNPIYMMVIRGLKKRIDRIKEGGLISSSEMAVLKELRIKEIAYYGQLLKNLYKASTTLRNFRSETP